MKDFALTRSPTYAMHVSYALLNINGNKEFLKTYFHLEQYINIRNNIDYLNALYYYYFLKIPKCNVDISV